MRGQAIVEYLVIATAVILTFLAVQARMRQSADGLYGSAKSSIDRAADGLANASLTGGKLFGN